MREDHCLQQAEAPSDGRGDDVGKGRDEGCGGEEGAEEARGEGVAVVEEDGEPGDRDEAGS